MIIVVVTGRLACNLLIAECGFCTLEVISAVTFEV